jgi:ribosome-associated translation inhibitor RaiA
MQPRPEPALPDVHVELRGVVAPEAADHARAAVTAMFEHAHEPILYARVVLAASADPAVARPATAQANLDLNGRLVRAHVAAETMDEAIDLLADRLRTRLERMALDWEARRARTTSPQPHEWRHGDEPSHRPGYYPRPPDERQIVRHKSFALAVETPDEAAFEMDAMDYDFHLFTDVADGLDAVIYRAGPTGYRVARTGPPAPAAGPTAIALTQSAQPALELTVNEAVERLDVTGWPFVFFVNPDSDRGNVLYRRYDGHYGLITPALAARGRADRT